MDRIEQVKKLREEYVRALDAAESRRSAYHEAVLELYQGGTPLREIAKELGLSHQRVHQIVSGEPPRRSKLPRAAGGAAVVVIVLAVATFGALRLARAPSGSPRPILPPRIRAAFRGHGFIPGGAVLRQKREVLVRTNPVGQFSLWVAPDRVSHDARCSWLALGRMGLGGTCYQLSPARGIPEVVPRFFGAGLRNWRGPAGPAGRSRAVAPPRTRLLIWGRTSRAVDRLTLVFRDGKTLRVPARSGMFIITLSGRQWGWPEGDRPSFLVARDAQGRMVDKRPVRLDLATSF